MAIMRLRPESRKCYALCLTMENIEVLTERDLNSTRFHFIASSEHDFDYSVNGARIYIKKTYSTV